MPRFVILLHTLPPTHARATHWDLMIESGDRLRTWALDAEPASGVEISATALADHRREYLDYEGPVSGERGQVSQWDQGQSRLLEDGPAGLTIELEGRRLIGTATLRAGVAADQRWTFFFSSVSEPEATRGVASS